MSCLYGTFNAFGKRVKPESLDRLTADGKIEKVNGISGIVNEWDILTGVKITSETTPIWFKLPLRDGVPPHLKSADAKIIKVTGHYLDENGYPRTRDIPGIVAALDNGKEHVFRTCIKWSDDLHSIVATLQGDAFEHHDNSIVESIVKIFYVDINHKTEDSPKPVILHISSGHHRFLDYSEHLTYNDLLNAVQSDPGFNQDEEIAYFFINSRTDMSVANNEIHIKNDAACSLIRPGDYIAFRRKWN